MGREDWLNREQANRAVEALQKHVSEVEAKQKPKLIEEDSYIYMVASFKKIQQSRSAPQRISLPHPLINPKEMTICLFSKDPKPKMKEFLSAHKIDFVTKIISLKKLRSEFKTHERRRLLASMYDVFIADHRILQILYNKLGKAFLAKKGFPYLVNLTKKDPKTEILAALSSTHYRPNNSKSLSVRVGRLSMTPEEVMENLASTIRGVVRKVPKGWHGVHSLNIKTSESTSLPVYNSLAVEPTKITTI